MPSSSPPPGKSGWGIYEAILEDVQYQASQSLIEGGQNAELYFYLYEDAPLSEFPHLMQLFWQIVHKTPMIAEYSVQKLVYGEGSRRRSR